MTKMSLALLSIAVDKNSGKFLTVRSATRSDTGERVCEVGYNYAKSLYAEYASYDVFYLRKNGVIRTTGLQSGRRWVGVNIYGRVKARRVV